MSSSTHDVQTFQFSSQHRIFVDTNVWIAVYGPSYPGDLRSKRYSNALKQARQAGSKLLLDFMVCSEFVNTFLNIELRKSKVSNRKAFRTDPQYPYLVKEIADRLREIVKFAEVLENGHSRTEVGSYIDTFDSSASDFNDIAIADRCSRGSLLLLTDDGDFAGLGLEIVTANTKMIGPR